MKILINLYDDNNLPIAGGVLLQTDVVDTFGNIFTKEALVRMLEQLQENELLVVDRTDQ